MKKTLYTILLGAISITSQAQSIDEILSKVEANNATLKTLRQMTDAEKYEAHTGNTLSDPNVGFNYLVGSPSGEEANRYDISLTQSFDFPSAYQYRRKIADGNANMADLRYLVSRRDILGQAAQLYVQIAYLQNLREILYDKGTITSDLLNATSRSYEEGEASIIDLNRVRTTYLNSKKAMMLNEIEISKAVDELTLLNGGITLELPSVRFEIPSITSDFEQWFSEVCNNCPELLIEQQNIEQADNNIKLQKALNLPKFTLGYMSERTKETTLQGASFEMSIPIFERKNTLRTAKAKKAAAEEQMRATTLQHKNELKALHARATTLSELAIGLEKMRQECGDIESLKKAIQNGHITLINYQSNITEYYDTQIDILETKREAILAILALKMYEN